MNITKADLQKEIMYKTSRSGGKGGQNVNKVSSYVQVICDEERSQYLNKEKAIERLIVLLARALQVQKPRKPTKPGKKAKAERLDNKKAQSAKKENRKRSFDF
jgi:ribosome-associated protein